MMPVVYRLHRWLAASVSIAVLGVMTAAPAHASGSSMPWEQPLQQILQSIETTPTCSGCCRRR